jgi:hypothetical protein
VAAEAEGVVFEELALDLAEAGRERLAVEALERGLGVIEIDVAGAADHEEQDALLGTDGEVRGGTAGGVIREFRPGIAMEEIGEAEESEASAHRAQHSTPAASGQSAGAWTATRTLHGAFLKGSPGIHHN